MVTAISVGCSHRGWGSADEGLAFGAFTRAGRSGSLVCDWTGESSLPRRAHAKPLASPLAHHLRCLRASKGVGGSMRIDCQNLPVVFGRFGMVARLVVCLRQQQQDEGIVLVS